MILLSLIIKNKFFTWLLYLFTKFLKNFIRLVNLIHGHIIKCLYIWKFILNFSLLLIFIFFKNFSIFIFLGLISFRSFFLPLSFTYSFRKHIANIIIYYGFFFFHRFYLINSGRTIFITKWNMIQTFSHTGIWF